MCQWFSCVSDGRGNMFYFNAEQRQRFYDGKELKYKSRVDSREELESHSGICAFYGLDCDKVNKYEFRPLDRRFTIDQINNRRDDSEKIKYKCQRLNYQELAPPELIWKLIVNPFKLKRQRVTESDIALLRKWDSVRGSVWSSVYDSVRSSAVGESVCDSIWVLIGDTVNDSVCDSVCDSVWGYIGSFFNLDKWKHIKHAKGEYPFQPVVDLWERGIIPSFEGGIWRLYGHKGKILKEISFKEK